MRLTANDIVQRYEALDSERKNLDGIFQLLSRFVAPGKGRFFREGSEEEEEIDWTHRELFDATAQQSAKQLASNIHSALTSPGSKWFELRYRSEELNDSREASAWLEDCAERMRASYHDSNFYLEANEAYLDGVSFGTTVLLHNERESGLLWSGHRFRTEMLRDCFFEENSDGEPTGLFIKRQMSPMQLAQRFGRAALPSRVNQKLDNPNVATTEKDEALIYAVYQDIDRDDRDQLTLRPVSQRPYVGRYVLSDGREFVGEEEGFYEFPAYVLRWERTAGSKYGHCPGIVSLPDILTLQEMVQMARTATEKTVDPPMKTTRQGVIGDLELEAGGVTAVRKMEDLQPMLPPGAYRIEAGWQDIADLRSRIERAFYVDSLQLKESPQMTATEVQIRYEIMQRLLGPTLGRIQSDFLDPLIERTFHMMLRKGAFEQMPEVVSTVGADLDIEYVGPLARAQRMSSADNLQRWYAGVQQMAQFNPDLLDLPDDDEIVKHLADIYGVPAKLIRPENEVRARRKQGQQAAQQQITVEQAQGVAKAARDVSQADPGMLANVGAGLPQ